VTFLTDFAGKVHFNSPFTTENTTYYKHTTNIDYTYKVKNELWHNVVFVLCTKPFYSNAVMAPTVRALPTLQSSVHTEVLGMQPLSALHTTVRSLHTSQRSGAMQHSIYTVPMNTATTPTAAAHTTHTSTLTTHSTPYDNKYAAHAIMTGTIAFHNPYGYIPAELYGMLPFQVRT